MKLVQKKTAGARRYHSVSHIADALDLSIAMVHKLIHEGVLEEVRFRRMVRVTDESYQRLLASLERTPKSAA